MRSGISFVIVKDVFGGSTLKQPRPSFCTQYHQIPESVEAFHANEMLVSELAVMWRLVGVVGAPPSAGGGGGGCGCGDGFFAGAAETATSARAEDECSECRASDGHAISSRVRWSSRGDTCADRAGARLPNPPRSPSARPPPQVAAVVSTYEGNCDTVRCQSRRSAAHSAREQPGFPANPNTQATATTTPSLCTAPAAAPQRPGATSRATRSATPLHQNDPFVWLVRPTVRFPPRWSANVRCSSLTFGPLRLRSVCASRPPVRPAKIPGHGGTNGP